MKEKVGLEAQRIGKNINEGIIEKLEEVHSKEQNGIFLGVTEILTVGETGEILPEKPYVYFDIEYTGLFFQPLQNEVVEGFVTEVAEFGPFVRIGPVDALVHISQITDEKLTYNPEQDIITSKDSKIIIKKNEPVRAIVANSSISEERMRINLSMKQDGLGLLSLLKKGKKAKN